MLRKIVEKIKGLVEAYRFETLKAQFEMEDLYKEVLFEGRFLSEEKIKYRQDLLNQRIAKRKNLYIYPTKVNV